MSYCYFIFMRYNRIRMSADPNFWRKTMIKLGEKIKTLRKQKKILEKERDEWKLVFYIPV